MKKKYIIKVLVTFFAFISLFSASSKSYAIDRPNVSISPASQLVLFQSFTVNVTNCSAGDEVWIGIFEDGAQTSLTSKRVPRAANGSASAGFEGLRNIAPGGLTVRVNCGGQDFNYVSIITIIEFNGPIALRHEQTVPNSARVFAEGCPPNSEVKFEYRLYPAVIFTTFMDESDSNGLASFALNAAGDYVVKASCGGITSSDYAFTITEDGSQGAVFPTLPPPPEPPCEVKYNGKCTGVATGIGQINTDGAGILYSLFVLILSTSGGVLVLIIIYAGYLLMMSRGNPEQIQKAKELLTSAIVGFLFIIFSYVILGVLTDDLLNLPGFETEGCLPNDASCVGP